MKQQVMDFSRPRVSWDAPCEFPVSSVGLALCVRFTPGRVTGGTFDNHMFEFRGERAGFLSNTGYCCLFVFQTLCRQYPSPVEMAAALAEKQAADHAKANAPGKARARKGVPT